MPIKKLKDYLDKNNIEYITIRHSLAFNAQQIAATTHIPGKELAKTVMVKIDGKMAMAVLPASYLVNLKLLKELTGAKTLELANEMEFKHLFPECEIGAMPPFGNLYDMEVFVAQSLAEDKEIAFNAGTHVELIRMAYADFERLVQPIVLAFSTARTA
ncbi:YbaK/EbsC family protein [uncultured Sunxiuqinia sp.]|uniref:aminoacyl-tRNA deacylase n=1 Tax=uncultured Sunxiuqinia sp. TaxID=1573825 RepID=UPI00198BC403|nr:YbaK/EbsC family protein [Sunxiuqinia sp.]|tara:strand:- start:31747 stop:32220 length:474 start_codon:yes stop_codon:yes gene_type:complete